MRYDQARHGPAPTGDILVGDSMADRSQKYFRVDYDARLVDGTPFRPNTWMVLDDVRSIEGAAMSVRALHRREAKLRNGMDCVVTIRKVEEVSRSDFDEFLRDSVTGSNILQRDDTQAEASRRGVYRPLLQRNEKKRSRWRESCGDFLERNRPARQHVRSRCPACPHDEPSGVGGPNRTLNRISVAVCLR